MNLQPRFLVFTFTVSLIISLVGCNDGKNNNRPKVEIRIFLKDAISQSDSTSLVDYLLSRAYVSEMEYISKEDAKRLYLANGGEDWSKVLDENPLPSSIHITLKDEYAQIDSVKSISSDLQSRTGVKEVSYPEVLLRR